jgi:hypothetical protein
MKHIFMITFFAALCLAGSSCGEPNIGFVPPMGPPPHNFDQMPRDDRDPKAADIRGGEKNGPARGSGYSFPPRNFMNEKAERAISDTILNAENSGKTDPEIADIAKRLRAGESLNRILDPQRGDGRLSFREMGPLPMIGGFLIPVIAIIGACLVFSLYLKLKSKRDMLLIEKNLFGPKDITGFRVDAALSVAGTVLIFWGIALTVFNMIVFGARVRAIGAGIIPFIIGIGCYIAFLIYRKLFPETARK